jgi:hypothetical protein
MPWTNGEKQVFLSEAALLQWEQILQASLSATLCFCQTISCGHDYATIAFLLGFFFTKCAGSPEYNAPRQAIYGGSESSTMRGYDH